MSHESLARHRAVLPNWVPLYYDEPIEIVSGRGRRVTDAAGRTYLDFFGGIVTVSIGYGIREIDDAVREQLASGVVHTSTLYLIRRQIELAERVAELSGIPDAKVFFTTSATEANETALLLATAARRSPQVLALRNSYHGRGFAAMAVTGNRGWSASALSPLRVSWVTGAYRYRTPFRDLSDAAYVDACVADLREVIATTTSGDVACMIVEPIQGVGGFATPPDGLFRAYKEVLDEHGILLISDEVQTGWGRTGEHLWGIQAHDVVPDAITFGKGFANGFPIGGVVARADLVDAVTANSMTTFGGNPLCTTAALATLDYMAAHNLQANAAKHGVRLLAGLRALAERHPAIGDVRGKGLLVGFELVGPGGEPDADAAGALLEETRRRGLLVGRGGLYRNVIRLAPPMTLTDDELDEALGVLAAATAAISR